MANHAVPTARLPRVSADASQQMTVVQSSAIGGTTSVLKHSYFKHPTNIQRTIYFMQNHVPGSAASRTPLSKPLQGAVLQPPQSQHDRSDCRYVNPKQLHRILKRREARQKLVEELGPSVRGPYFNESRHNHAKTRPRGPGGRFLGKEEYKQKKKEDLKDKSKKAVVTPGARDSSSAAGAELSTNQLPGVEQVTNSLFAPILSGVYQFFPSDGLTAMADGMAPGQPHQQRTYVDKYLHSYDIRTTSDSSAVIAKIQDFNEVSHVVDSRSSLPPDQQTLSSIASWHSITSAANPMLHDRLPVTSTVTTNGNTQGSIVGQPYKSIC